MEPTAPRRHAHISPFLPKEVADRRIHLECLHLPFQRLGDHFRFDEAADETEAFFDPGWESPRSNSFTEGTEGKSLLGAHSAHSGLNAVPPAEPDD